MSFTFADLVRIYCQSEFVDKSGRAVFFTDSLEDIKLLSVLTSDEYFDKSGIQVINGKLAINQRILLEIEPPDLMLGRLFSNFEEFVRGDMAYIHNSRMNDKPYFIKSEKIADSIQKKPQYMSNYASVKTFLRQLISMASYSDNVNKKLIFFSKKNFELSIDITKQLTSFCNLLRELNEDQLQVITGFCEWLNDEETSAHIDEKKSILAFVFSDILQQEATIIHVLQNIRQISELVQNQYALYLENFSYEKFIKKLAENSEKFVTKVNDTINKVLPQFLGLPFLTVIPTVLKSGDNWLVYLALLAYCIMCFLALNYQKSILDYLKQDVDAFEAEGKIPENLRNQWNKDKEKIDSLLEKQKCLYYLLLFSVVLCGIYALIKFLLECGAIRIICNF